MTDTLVPDADVVIEPGVRALEAQRIRKTIGGRAIVDAVDLAVEDGELLALVGPSGCGKSTLLRILAGLEPAEGRVLLRDVDVSALPAERRRIGLVFQDHALFPHLRIDQNLTFGVRHLSRRARHALVGELLDLVRLPDVAKRYPHELSGGEQQRIALARALAPEPPVVLLDEPFANLDATLRDSLRSDVVTALRARRTSAVLVTHDRDEALLVGDRVAVMRDGRILQVDHPERVYEAPTDRFVAGFLGDVAFLPHGDGGVVMARPHDLRVEPGGPDRVLAHHYLGSVWRYEVARADGVTLVAEAPAGTDLVDVGAPCAVRIVADHPLHRLD
ncbi:MAG: ABC transporter ATP-binding protein [Ilumatobacter sp.]|jgi:iron(III) transport system ATP-binding protein|uniref:ABC transporter ATP-binding protein n=1 Tax=Ilumatobacter sp. TaxID=1967498 RepID=UPI00391D9BC0